VFVVVFVLSLGAELAGTHTGFPFGPYGYTTRLGYKILDLVPFNIPTSWFYMLVGCLAICGRLLPAKDDGASKWWWAFMSGVFLTAWDVSMDPAMVKTQHWLWRIPEFESNSVAWLFGHALFYGMPLTNWLGWLLTGVVIARVALAIVPPSTWARTVAPFRFPLVLYAVNGVLPLAVCFRQDMIPAGVLGTLAMGIPLWLAWRAESRVAVPAGPSPGHPVAASGD
jgi:putative membrane protein